MKEYASKKFTSKHGIHSTSPKISRSLYDLWLSGFSSSGVWMEEASVQKRYLLKNRGKGGEEPFTYDVRSGVGDTPKADKSPDILPYKGK